MPKQRDKTTVISFYNNNKTQFNLILYPNNLPYHNNIPEKNRHAHFCSVYYRLLHHIYIYICLEITSPLLNAHMNQGNMGPLSRDK